MLEIDKKLIEKSCKKVILDIAMESKYLKENTTFNQQVKICNKIVNMSYNGSVSYVFNNGELLDEFGVRDFENKFKKYLKYGMAALAGGTATAAAHHAAGVGFKQTAGRALVKVPAISMLAYYMFRKVTDPCWQACVKKPPFTNQKAICKYECQVNAAKNIVRDIKTQISKCDQTPNPPKCARSLQSQYIKWSNKLQEQIIKLRIATSKRDEIEKRKREKG